MRENLELPLKETCRHERTTDGPSSPRYRHHHCGAIGRGTARRLRRHGREGRAASPRRRCARLSAAQGRQAAVVEGDQPRQAPDHAGPAQARGLRLAAEDAAALRRAGRELPARHARRLGPHEGGALESAAGPRDPSHDRFRPDRPLQEPAGIRAGLRGHGRPHLHQRRSRWATHAHGLSDRRQRGRSVRCDRRARRPVAPCARSGVTWRRDRSLPDRGHAEATGVPPDPARATRHGPPVAARSAGRT